MRNNETGEFELVVGNRQLLSGFFIVVLLFAVAFAMGYVVGQNSPRSSKIETASVPTPAVVPDTSRPAPAGNAVPPEAAKPDLAAQPPADTSAGAPPAESEAPPQPTTQPARETAPGKTAPPPAAAEVPATTAPGQLAPGTYWQAIAVPQHEAEVMATGLKEKGFAVVLTPGTKGLTRVLVGPYNDKQTLGRAKTELENAGLHPFLFK
jgi:cell division septation protein DedD